MQQLNHIFNSDCILLSDFGIVESKAHVAVPGEAELIGILQHRRRHSCCTRILQFGHQASVSLTVVEVFCSHSLLPEVT